MFHLNSRTIQDLSFEEAQNWILEIERTQLNLLNDAARKILAGGYTLVALSGPSCSGKSTTAHRLISFFQQAGKDVKVISTDDYFHNIADYPKSHGGAPDFDHFDCMKKSLLSEVLRGICAGEEVSLSRFDFITGRRTDDVERFQPSENSLVILEGIHALNPLLWREGVRFYKFGLNVTSGITLDGEELLTAREVRLIRRIIRDEKKRNYRAEQTLNIWANVARGEENFIFPFFQDADTLLSTDLCYEPCIWREDALNSLNGVEATNPFRAQADELYAKIERFPTLSANLVPNDSILQEFLGHNEH